MMDRARTTLLVAVAMTSCRTAPTGTTATDAGGAPKGPGIATGQVEWFETMPDDPLLDARVDIGTLRSVGEEIEVAIMFASAPGYMMSWRKAHPDLTIPAGTTELEKERVQCRLDGPLYYEIESRLIAPDGHEIVKMSKDPAAQLAAASETQAKLRALLHDRAGPYGKDPRSLACLAAASKCRGVPLAWPPPPNNTPLEYSKRADNMLAAYNAPFVPACKL
jgi:hypothetical protein